MGGKKNDEDRTVDLLRSYRAELSDERSGLEHVIIDPPDGQGDDAERDRDRAFRRCLTHPADVTAADACIEALTRFKDKQSSLDDVQVKLCLMGQTGLADALARRRTRREADVDRMIGAAENLKDAIRKSDAQADEFADEVGVPYDVAKALKDALTEQPTFGVPSGSQCAKPTDPSVIDYRQWEDAAARFNRGIADDVGFIGKIVARPNALDQSALQKMQEDIEVTKNGVGFLVDDRKEKIKGNKTKGRKIWAKGADTAERKRAVRDMETALKRVRDRVSHGEKNVLGICRSVCEKFARLSDAKNEAGQYNDFAPLTGESGKPIKPETLAKNYRTKCGTAKARKANTAKNKARTQAAREAKSTKAKRTK